MPINTQHPEFIAFSKQWKRSSDALKMQDHIHSLGTEYLPKTRGMEDNDADGKRYEAYKSLARFPDITSQALTGTVGLVFESDPVGDSDEVITNTGQTNKALARDVVRNVVSKGRDILVVDAPENGGTPYIVRYPAESLINWKLEDGNAGALKLAVFREEVGADDTDEYGHDTTIVYRKYRRVDSRYEVSLWTEKGEQIGETSVLPVDEMPIVIIGSINLTPDCDPVPILPVANCAFAYYRASASYKYSIDLCCHPTLALKGYEEDDFQKVIKTGLGGGAAIPVPEDGDAFFLETEGKGIERARTDMQDELEQAETYAVRLTQKTDNAESGRAMAIRASAQHASIYSIADAVGIGVTRAMQIRAKWGGISEPEPFRLRTEFTQEYAGEQMINALNSAVNSSNAPRSALFEAIRRSGLSDKTDEDMMREIETDNGDGGDLNNNAT